MRPLTKTTTTVQLLLMLQLLASGGGGGQPNAPTCEASISKSDNNSTTASSSSTSSLPIMAPFGGAQNSLGIMSHASSHDSRDTLSSSLLKTFIRTNSMRAYHLDLHSYRRDAKFEGDPSFVDSLSEAHKLRCSRHLATFDALLRTFRNADPILEPIPVDSLQLADSFGRPDSDALTGSQFWLGSYGNCLDFRHTPSSSPAATAPQATAAAATSGGQQTIRGHYCLAVAQFPNWNPSDTKNSLKIGLCLPDTCTSSMFNENPRMLERVETMMKYQFGDNQPYARIKVREVYCLPHETSPARQFSWSALGWFAFVGLFVVVALLATLIDHLQTNVLPKESNIVVAQLPSSGSSRNWRNILIDSFSIKRNLHKLMTIREATNSEQQQQQQQTTEVSQPSNVQQYDSLTRQLQQVDSFNRDTFFNSITGIKCIGLLWIICAHTFMVTPIVRKNLIDMDKLTATIAADFLLTAHLMVDTFFALSGLLAAYLLFKDGIEKNAAKPGKWLVLTIHRYWRLTPIYLICYWFTKAVGHAVNSGPLWDYMTAEQSPRLNCARESWWEAILQMSDFKSPKEHCVPFAWFIANGIKFWIVTPIFLVLIHRSMRRGYAITLGSILANIVLVATLAMQSNVDMKSVIEFKPESADNMLNNMGQVYTRPYSRIGAYLVGLLAGHLIYLIDAGKMQVNLSKNAKIILWMLCSITVMVLMFVLKIAKGIALDDSAIPWVFGISSSLIRPLWSLCTCWLVFALSHGQAKWLAHFLSANFWRILVKLSFCAYLVQGEVIAQLVLARPMAEKYTYTDMISLPIIIIAMTLFVSFLMVIFLEYPLIGIEELLLPRRDKRKHEQELGAQKASITPLVSKLREQQQVQPCVAHTNGKLKSS